ncbi:MAG: LysM peptidoglycan-binding domain-containing protein [Candidatus Omnitrophica bacterium]|nr:LysM peptidoglycan-binding domain-containing protein [Candidatus Omnitrophota bacterium]
MSKKLISIIAVIIAILLVAFYVFNAKKIKLPMQLKSAGGVSVSALMSKAVELEADGNLIEAKVIYQKLTNDFPGSKDVMSWQKKAEDLNIKILFSPVVTAKCIVYTIKPGDSLAKIAKEFKTTPELIMKSNNISGEKIFAGRKIKVYNAPFSILVDKSQNILILKSDEEIIKSYIVSTGANNSTPIGTFKIVNKLPNPTWFKAGAVVASGSPQNILGSRWLGLNLAGYGIHGTTEPQNLGKQATQGCVRMSNPEVEELYAIVPEGTEVIVID